MRYAAHRISYSFVPSNLWVAVGWRNRDDITVDLAATLKRRDVALKPEGVKKVYPKENRIELGLQATGSYPGSQRR